MKNNKGFFWGLLLVALGLLWLGRSFDLFHFSWCHVWRLWPLIIIWLGVSLLPIEQLWKNVCNIVLLALAIVLLFVLPAKSCHRHWFDKWHNKEIIMKKAHDRDYIINNEDEDDLDLDENVDIDLNLDDENISVSVKDGVITIHQENNEDGEKKVIVKEIKL